MVQLVVSLVLYFVIFFGIAFILNMLLRTVWLMAYIYPIIIILIVGESPVTDYFVRPLQTLSHTYHDFLAITFVDGIILASGLAGTIVCGFVIKYLRKSGYQMF